MTDPQNPASDDRPRLASFQGEPVPEAVATGWAEFLTWGPSTQQAFVELLVSTVVERDEAALGQALERFCEANGIQGAAALSVLRTCQGLLRHGAALDLEPEDFMEDLRKLSAGESGAMRLVGTRYVPLKRRIREGLLAQALADHGQVLTGLSWRVDRLEGSDRAVGLNAPVVWLTLEVQEGEESRRHSMQLTPDAIQALRNFTARFSQG
jgi:hypothetical protein